jgi:hypothetical protein
MAILEAINLNRRWGTVVPDRLPQSDIEFHALHIVLEGVDELWEGREPSNPEFVEFVMGSPAVQEARLRWAPAAGETQ